MNNSGIRADLVVSAAGRRDPSPVTYGELYQAQPFGNTLTTPDDDRRHDQAIARAAVHPARHARGRAAGVSRLLLSVQAGCAGRTARRSGLADDRRPEDWRRRPRPGRRQRFPRRRRARFHGVRGRNRPDAAASWISMRSPRTSRTTRRCRRARRTGSSGRTDGRAGCVVRRLKRCTTVARSQTAKERWPDFSPAQELLRHRPRGGMMRRTECAPMRMLAVTMISAAALAVGLHAPD